MTTEQQLCWICNNLATTREHTTNQAIIAIVAGKPEVGAPWFFHDDWGGLNQPLQGLNSNLLKPYVDLCADCNNQRTQPHDKAVEQFVRWLIRSNPQVGDTVKPDDVWLNHSGQKMLHLHLYFAKKFGCLVTEARCRGILLNVDVSQAAKAIRSGTSCPNLYLKFGRRRLVKEQIARTRPVRREHNGRLLALDWVHYYGHFAVELRYRENARTDDPFFVGAWHPNNDKRGLTLISIDRPIVIDPNRS